MGNPDPVDFIINETNQIPFKNSNINPEAWKNTFRTWPLALEGWRDWYRRIVAKRGDDWVSYDLQQCITLTLSDLRKNEPMLIAACYFWLNSANSFVFGHGPMTPTLADVFMLTGLKVTGSYNPHEFTSARKQKIFKVSDLPNWSKYIANNKGTKRNVDEKEHVAFLNMWLEKFFFCGITLAPTVNHLRLAEVLSSSNEAPLGKILLGSFYQMMNRVSLKLLGNEAVGGAQVLGGFYNFG